MKFIANAINGDYLRNVHLASSGKASSIKIAIAYASGDPEIFRDSFNDGVRIAFWCRYDSSIPVSTPILKKFLDRKSPNYTCRLVPDIFHAKIIWWEEFGAYIGSANLTDRAWYTNIESGIFLSQEELIENNIIPALEDFFDELNNMSTPLTIEIYNEICRQQGANKQLDALKNNLDNNFNQKRLIPKLRSTIVAPTKHEKANRRKNAFLSEWYDTLQILRDIAEKVSLEKNRPSWIKANVPSGVQADQFLHAHYYCNVKEGNKALHFQHYAANKNDPASALNSALAWWRKLKEAPHEEDIMINDWAVYLQDRFRQENILKVEEEEFIKICERVHALRNYALRVRYSVLGYKPPYPNLDLSERIKELGALLYKEKSLAGKGILDSLFHLLYGGPIEKAPDRLWEVAESEEWKIPNLGISSLGEIIGWALPNTFPPRNGRTSKALTALGYPVRIHSQ